MKKILILLSSILVCCLGLVAQPSVLELAKNEMKYWKLRGRINGDDNNKDVYNGFMTVGLGAGKSIPTYKRIPISPQNFWFFDPNINPTSGLTKGECANQSIYYQNTIDIRDNSALNGINDWEDNPLVSLGNYLGVLATEWDLLHKNGSSTWQTETEIYYALKAVERLEYYAESANCPRRSKHQQYNAVSKS